MRRVSRDATILIIVLVSAFGVAAQRVGGPEEFAQTMKTIAAAMATANKAFGAGANIDAKAQFVFARQLLATTAPFWRDRKVQDATRLTREAVARLDALDEALSADPIDSAAVKTAIDRVTAACSACHAAYREGTPQTGFRFKPGLF